MLIKNLSLLLALLLPFLLRDGVFNEGLYFQDRTNPIVEHTVGRDEGILHRQRVWYSIAVRDLTSVRLLSTPTRCYDPFGHCEARLTLSLPSLSGLDLRLSAITDSHQEFKMLECDRLRDGQTIRVVCAGEIPSGATVRGIALFPSALDGDPTFNRVRMEPATLSWSLGSQVAILGALVGLGALLIRYSLKAAGANLIFRLAQGYAAMFALSCALSIPRVCKPGFGANAIDIDGRRYYLMKLTGLGYNVILTLGEHALACGVIVATIALPTLLGTLRRRATERPPTALGIPQRANDVYLSLGLTALLFPVAMWLYPRALNDIWALALSSLSLLLLYDLLSNLQTNDSSATAKIGLSVKPAPILGGLLLGGVLTIVFLHSSVFFKQPLLLDSRVPLNYAHSLLSGVVAPSLDQASFTIMQGYIFIRDGAWFPIQPPGHLGLLMVSSIVGLGGIPGVIGFVLSFALLVSLAKTLNFSTSGLYATVALFITSPTLVLMHAESMNHISALTFLLLALLGAYRAVEAETGHATRWMVVCGAASGAMAVTRPLTAAGMLCPIAIWLIAHPHLRMFRPWVCALGAALPFLVAYLVYNKVTTGSYLLSGYEASYGTSHNPGFGVDPEGEAFTLGRGFARTIGQFGSLSSNALIAPVPLFLVALFGYRVPRLRPILASALGLPLAYLFYWHDGGPYFSPRFLFESIPLWCLMIGGILSSLSRDRTERLPQNHHRAIASVFTSLIIFYVAVSMLFPVRDTLHFYEAAAARTDLS